MGYDPFTVKSTICCPLCGAACAGTAALERHLANVHSFTPGVALRLANLLQLDVQKAVEDRGNAAAFDASIAWDITASQAKGRDVRRGASPESKRRLGARQA